MISKREWKKINKKRNWEQKIIALEVNLVKFILPWAGLSGVRHTRRLLWHFQDLCWSSEGALCCLCGQQTHRTRCWEALPQSNHVWLGCNKGFVTGRSLIITSAANLEFFDGYWREGSLWSRNDSGFFEFFCFHETGDPVWQLRSCPEDHQHLDFFIVNGTVI